MFQKSDFYDLLTYIVFNTSVMLFVKLLICMFQSHFQDPLTGCVQYKELKIIFFYVIYARVVMHLSYLIQHLETLQRRIIQSTIQAYEALK